MGFTPCSTLLQFGRLNLIPMIRGISIDFVEICPPCAPVRMPRVSTIQIWFRNRCGRTIQITFLARAAKETLRTSLGAATAEWRNSLHWILDLTWKRGANKNCSSRPDREGRAATRFGSLDEVSEHSLSYFSGGNVRRGNRPALACGATYRSTRRQL